MQGLDADRYLVDQLVRPIVNLYRVTPLAAGETPAGPPVAYVRQKKMAIKEDIRFYGDENETREIFRIKARSVFDIGGARYEPQEENPMLGFRGASRYIAASFRDCFRLECEAMRKVRDTMGLTNVELMVPFVRTVKEGEAVLAIMKEYGLERGKNGLRIVMMCEIPSNAILADDFLRHFDGFWDDRVYARIVDALRADAAASPQ